MSNCNSYNPLTGVIGTWEICVDIPTYEQEGVYYQYPGEPEIFVGGGLYWTCKSNLPYDVFLGSVTVSAANKEGKSGSITFPVVYGGKFQQILTTATPASDWGIAYNSLTPYRCFFATDQGVYGTALDEHTGEPYPYIGNESIWETHFQPLPTIPRVVLGSADIGGHAGTTGVSPPSGNKIGVVYPSGHQDFTFTIYDRGGNTKFQRTDTSCPNARYQPEKCQYTGKFLKIIHPSRFGLGLRRFDNIFYTSAGPLYCSFLFETVPVFNINNLSLTPGLIGSWCSSPGCKMFPLIQTSPGYAGQCPPGTCAIACGGQLCCYNMAGQLVATIPQNAVNNNSTTAGNSASNINTYTNNNNTNAGSNNNPLNNFINFLSP